MMIDAKVKPAFALKPTKLIPPQPKPQRALPFKPFAILKGQPIYSPAHNKAIYWGEREVAQHHYLITCLVVDEETMMVHSGDERGFVRTWRIPGGLVFDQGDSGSFEFVKETQFCGCIQTLATLPSKSAKDPNNAAKRLLVATDNPPTVTAIDPESGQVVLTREDEFAGPTKSVTCALSLKSDDADVVLGCQDSFVYIDGVTYGGHDRSILCLACRKDDSACVYSAGADGRIVKHQKSHPSTQLCKFECSVTGLQCIGSQALLCTLTNGSICILDCKDGAIVVESPLTTKNPQQILALHPAEADRFWCVLESGRFASLCFEWNGERRPDFSNVIRIVMDGSIDASAAPIIYHSSSFSVSANGQIVTNADFDGNSNGNESLLCINTAINGDGDPLCKVIDANASGSFDHHHLICISQNAIYCGDNQCIPLPIKQNGPLIDAFSCERNSSDFMVVVVMQRGVLRFKRGQGSCLSLVEEAFLAPSFLIKSAQLVGDCLWLASEHALHNCCCLVDGAGELKVALECPFVINTMAVSDENGDSIIIADNQRHIHLYKQCTKVRTQWTFHNASITSLRYLPPASDGSSSLFVSSGKDACLYLWSSEWLKGPIACWKDVRGVCAKGIDCIDTCKIAVYSDVLRVFEIIEG